MANEFARNIQDGSSPLSQTPALPNGAATAYGTVVDLGSGNVAVPENIEIEVTIPDATTSEAPDTRTLTVDVVAGSTSTPTTGVTAQTVYTGAGGAGFTGSTFRLRLPSSAGRYFRLRMVGGTSFGNMSAKSATFKVLF